MTVSGIESTSASPGLSAAGATTATTSTTSGDKDMFLQLMVAQMKYQDPSNPTDSAEFLAQSAQFTALEKMQTVADQTAQLVGLQVAFGASNLVGKTVSYTGADGTTMSGVVTAARFETTGPVLQVNGEEVRYADVRSVGDGSTHLTTFEPDPDESLTV